MSTEPTAPLPGRPPRGGTTLLARLTRGTLPVHDHAGDDGGGLLPGYPTRAEADARYAALEHTHPWQSAARDYYFSTNPSVTGDPGPGNLRSDTGSLTTATTLALDALTNDGLDLGRVVGTLLAGDGLVAQDKDQATTWVRLELTAAPAWQGGWWRLAVRPLGTAGVLAASQLVSVVFFLESGAPLALAEMSERVATLEAELTTLRRASRDGGGG